MTAAKAKRVAKAKGLVSRLNRRIARDNRAFAKMSKAQKRVRIAQDVLEQLEAKRLIAERGTWLDAPVKIGARLGRAKITGDTELRDVFKGLKTCNGCAIGGLFLCAVERADAFKVRELGGYEDHEDVNGYVEPGTRISGAGSDDAFDFLAQFFDRDELDEIEAAFEAESYDPGVRFVEEIEDPSERMRLIMENIVVHKGRFDPEDKPEAKYYTPGFEG